MVIGSSLTKVSVRTTVSKHPPYNIDKRTKEEGVILEKKCSICKVIIKELGESGSSKLERRLYNCSKFVKGGETQRAICKEYSFSPISMTHHLAKHQNPDENVLIQKKFEQHLENKKLRHEEVRQRMMEKGMEALEEGEIKMNASVLRGVAKDTSDIEERNKDRQLKVLEMLNAFISGEITNDLEVLDADSTESPISYLEG